MAARKTKKTARKAKRKKTTRKTVRKKTRKVVRKKGKTPKAKISAAQEREYNRKALWKAFRDLQARAEKAWEKFHDDVKRNAPSEVLIKDRNQLLLMLGECNYMARECMRISNQAKRRA